LLISSFSSIFSCPTPLSLCFFFLIRPPPRPTLFPTRRSSDLPAINFKHSVDAYREAAEQSGFDPKTLPIGTTSLFYVAESTKEALRGMYPHINGGFQAIRGGGYPKQQFAQAPDTRDALMVGSIQQIIEKILYQYELYGM